MILHSDFPYSYTFSWVGAVQTTSPAPRRPRNNSVVTRSFGRQAVCGRALRMTSLLLKGAAPPSPLHRECEHSFLIFVHIAICAIFVVLCQYPEFRASARNFFLLFVCSLLFAVFVSELVIFLDFRFKACKTIVIGGIDSSAPEDLAFVTVCRIYRFGERKRRTHHVKR